MEDIWKILLGAGITLTTQCVYAFLSHSHRDSEDAKKVFREEMLRKMSSIGGQLYSLLACCDMYLKHCKQHADQLAQKGECPQEIEAALSSRLGKIGKHRKVLMGLVEDVRYFIWDENRVLERSFRLILKFAQFITNYRCRPDAGLEKMKIADKMRKELDAALIEIYKKGDLPTGRVCKRVAKILNELDDRPVSGNEEENL